MVFYEDRERNQVRADLTVPETYRSYPGVVHAILIAWHRGYYSCGRRCPHETLGRALMADQNRPQGRGYRAPTGDAVFFVTAKMEVRYRRATPTNTPLVALGWVERLGQNRSRVKGELRLMDGMVLAGARLLRPYARCLNFSLAGARK